MLLNIIHTFTLAYLKIKVNMLCEFYSTIQKCYSEYNSIFINIVVDFISHMC